MYLHKYCIYIQAIYELFTKKEKSTQICCAPATSRSVAPTNIFYTWVFGRRFLSITLAFLRIWG